MKILKISFLTGVAFLLGACSDTKTDDGPETGSVLILTDWSNRSEGADVPAAFNVVIGDQTFEGLNGESNTVEKIVAGTRELYIYNQASGINISGKTASVTSTGGFLDPMPGWFFTYSRDILVMEDAVAEVNAYMRQQVRPLNINLVISGAGTDRVSLIEGSLTGVASSINMVTGQETGNAAVPTVFSLENGKCTSHVRLLGIGTAGEQVLTLNILSDTGDSETVTSDLTEKLSSFNSAKSRPLTLSAEIYIPNEGNFTAMISDWDLVEEGDITAE